MDSAGNSRRDAAVRWIRRLGVTGFLFFLVKGLVWLAVGVLVGKGCF